MVRLATDAMSIPFHRDGFYKPFSMNGTNALAPRLQLFQLLLKHLHFSGNWLKSAEREAAVRLPPLEAQSVNAFLCVKGAESGKQLILGLLTT